MRTQPRHELLDVRDEDGGPMRTQPRHELLDVRDEDGGPVRTQPHQELLHVWRAVVRRAWPDDRWELEAGRSAAHEGR
jgi:hypothetical protein